MSPLNQSLLTVVELLLIVTLPLLALAALQSLRLNSARLKIESRAGETTAIRDAVKTAVAAAEQSGLLKGLIGPEKKEHALKVAEEFLRKQGLNVDLVQLSEFIEAEVLEQNREAGTAGAVTAAAYPTENQALISNAVETAVLAAEQSGSKGFIQNIGSEKKTYAINLATRFLEANGIRLDAELVDGLVEGELMKLFLAARGQLPSGG